jgi:hypothetical protein
MRMCSPLCSQLAVFCGWVMGYHHSKGPCGFQGPFFAARYGTRGHGGCCLCVYMLSSRPGFWFHRRHAGKMGFFLCGGRVFRRRRSGLLENYNSFKPMQPIVWDLESLLCLVVRTEFYRSTLSLAARKVLLSFCSLSIYKVVIKS